jgi:hypothetical protein
MCEVRISHGEIIVSYQGEDGPTVYRGIEEGAGHFRVVCGKNGGKGTLHRFNDDYVLEGWWVEGGSTGMWRVHLDHG